MNTHSLRRATRPKVDSKGFSKGKITYVETGKGIQIIGKGREAKPKPYPTYIFNFVVDGVSDEIEIKLITSTAINDIPLTSTGKGKGALKTYNRITTVCLNLDLIKEDELETLTDEKINEVAVALEKIKNLEVTFKIVRNNKGFLNIVPETIKTISEQQIKSDEESK